MDGDLQHDPAEIPAFIAKMSEGFDIVSGWRAQRQVHFYEIPANQPLNAREEANQIMERPISFLKPE